MAGKTQLKSLILTDSAGKARAIKKFVGRRYLVASTDGFLKDLPKSRIGIDAENNYAPDYITVRGKGPLLRELKRETLNARRIFLAMNPDARGEFLAKQCCQLFGVNEKSRCRMDFNELTKNSVLTALENARPIDDKLVDAFQTRQIIDKFVSHKIGEYLSYKIYRGVKVGRFRAMLLKIISGDLPGGEFNVKKNFTFGVLQELALKELNFSATKTRLVLDQLYEGLNFDKEGFGGLVKYPYHGEIFLTTEERNPDDVKNYLTDAQFKLYNLIYSQVNAGTVSVKIQLSGERNEAAILATLDNLKIDWAEFYSTGINSLIKRRYVALEDSVFKVTEMGKRVLGALDGFFDEIFSVDSYNKVAAQIFAVADGRAEKNSVIAGYCDKFMKSFGAAMDSLGEDAKPQEEPLIETDEICEKCGRPMLIKRGRYGQFLACSGYPECKNAKPIVEYTNYKCPKCGGRITLRNFGKNKNLFLCENSPTCNFMTWDEPQALACKNCGSTMFLHRFKDRPAMLYCGNENCPTRENHPVNKIIADSQKRYEARKIRKAELAAKKSESKSKVKA